MLLVVNAGSSSVKLALFDGLQPVAKASVERIGAGGPSGHAEALAEGLAAMNVQAADLTAAAHRVVHGGVAFRSPHRVTPAVLAGIEACIPLAPLHNPANLLGIHAVAILSPDLPQYASFDTAFHATNPEVATTYALPLPERDRGLRRYGFHGLSYAAIVRKVQENAPNTLPERLLALHLGNGASLCAIRQGQSVATTMGYSPLDGLTMGTRGGSLDPAVVLDLCARHGVDRATRMLNRESGLLALGGSPDMRQLQAAATGSFAIAHFCYWAIRHSGSMIAAMGGLDAIAFTGGIGENDEEVRMQILQGLDWIANGKPVHVIAADEEGQIAREALTLREAGE
ncbi:MAG: acetate/propionate family kinase [Tabrizicola sp.]